MWVELIIYAIIGLIFCAALMTLFEKEGLIDDWTDVLSVTILSITAWPAFIIMSVIIALSEGGKFAYTTINMFILEDRKSIDSERGKNNVR